jgi:hypothetical protein
MPWTLDSRRRSAVTTRSDFFEITAGALAGFRFVCRELPAAARTQAPPPGVVVNRGRARTVAASGTATTVPGIGG